MKRSSIFILLVTLSLFIASCGNTDSNSRSNTANTNAAKPAESAPTAETFMEMDRNATQAWLKGDTSYFEEILSAKFIGYQDGKRNDRDAEIKMIGSSKCDVKDWKLDDPQMAKIDDSTYVISYQGTFDAECEMGGRKMKVPSPMRSATVWTKADDTWQAAFHSSTPIMGSTASAPPTALTDDANKEAPAKVEPKAEDKAAANAAAPTAAKPSPSANTDALVKLHTAGWEAFKAKDAGWFNSNLTDGAAIVDPAGRWLSGKANIVKTWTETMKCEGITKVGLSDGFATAISPTVEILTGKGAADGTCDGQKNGGIYQSVVYVKQGDAWKMAFMFESPAM